MTRAMFLTGSSLLYPTVLSVFGQDRQLDNKGPSSHNVPPPPPREQISLKSLPQDCLTSRLSISQAAAATSVLVTRCQSPEVSRGCPVGSKVASPEPNVTRLTDKSSSRDLKFGIDRILSDDLSTKILKELKPSPAGISPYPVCLSGAVLLTAALHTAAASSANTSFPGCYDLQSCHCGQPYSLTSNPYTVPYSMHLLSGHPDIYPTTGMLNHEDDCNNHRPPQTGGGNKRKRSWSRAVFSNLQRKGLEKRFLIQKYITKPDRRQLAATLGLTDAQVKVWFQNRRMKWRHSKEGREEMARLTGGCSDKSTGVEEPCSRSLSIDAKLEEAEDLKSHSSQ